MSILGPTLRRTRRKEHPAWRVLLAVVISVGLNLLLVLKVDSGWLGFGKLPERRDVAMAPLTAADWEANRRVGPSSSQPRPQAPALPAPPPAALRPPETPTPPGQLVQLDEPTRPDQVQPVAPKETRFVSDRDQTVLKESKARLTPEREVGEKERKPTPAQLAMLGGAGGQGTARGRGERGQADETAKAALAGGQGAAVPAQGKGELAPAPGGPTSPVGGAAPAGGPDQRLALSPATAAKVLGRPVGQGIEDVDEGEGTFLNTKSWKYATYFNRIRESVGAAWSPVHEIDRRDPERSIYLFKDRLTVLAVTLDEKGGLKHVQVVRSSNVDFLDKVAVQAFEKAQPFANPPAGLVNDQGEIRYVLGFEVYGAHPGLHLYRGAGSQ
jgi:TonB family protein